MRPDTWSRVLMTDAVRESEERAVSSARRKASSIADSADAEGDGTTLARVLVRLRLEAFASQQRDGCAAASSAEAGVLDLTLEPSAPAVEGPSAAGRCQALPASPHAWRDQGLHDSRPEVGLSAHGVRGIEGRGSIDVPEPPAPQVESAFHGNRPVEPAPAPVVTPVEARAPQTAARGGGLIRAVPDRDVQAQVRAPQVHAAAQTDPPSASAVHPASTRSVLEDLDLQVEADRVQSLVARLREALRGGTDEEPAQHLADALCGALHRLELRVAPLLSLAERFAGLKADAHRVLLHHSQRSARP